METTQSFIQSKESALIKITRQVARDVIMPRFRNLSEGDVTQKTSASDLVTIADQKAEELLTKSIGVLLPDAKIIGEEAVADDPLLLEDLNQHEQLVIIDPIDGTWNYSRGLSTFGVILAVVSRGETIFGLLYDPVCDDLIAATKGGGAYYHSHRTLRTPLQVRPGQGGFMPHYAFPSENIARAIALGQTFGPIRSPLCSCHNYRTLASGGVSYGLIPQSKPWDHAAGVLIHEEAGGVSRFIDGEKYTPGRHEGMIINASSQSEFEELAATFKPLLPGLGS